MPSSSASARACRAHACGHGGVRGSQRGRLPMPALRLAASAVGARRHVSAGCGMAREPWTVRALCARARQWPRAVVGARSGRDDPWHHHAPVLEHGRKAAGCAPAEREHLGRLRCSLEARQRRFRPIWARCSRRRRRATNNAARLLRVHRPGRRAHRNGRRGISFSHRGKTGRIPGINHPVG